MRLLGFRVALAVVVLAPASLAGAQSRGTGSTWESWKVAGTRGDQGATQAALPAPGEQFDARRGYLGAPGAGQDALGESRLGARAEVEPVAPEGSWVAGDRARSVTSADVRSARQQEAPDLVWVDAASKPAEPGRDKEQDGDE